ncbi:MAG: phospholipase D-like domain-containing protein [Bacteroidales bacterium]
MTYLKYIKDQAHYNEVLSKAAAVRHTLWIGTADIKDLYVKKGISAIPFLKVLDALIAKGIQLRIICAKKPGVNFKTDFEKCKHLKEKLQMMICPRVHFKMMIFDRCEAYLGSANLTGAGLGMKGSTKRNFECGILTNIESIVDQAADHYHSVWQGEHCKSCGRKQFCKNR